MSDTADRSLAHWSETGRRGMEAFYSVATKDYRLLAEAHDWAATLEGVERALDVACGSGKFPAALCAHTAVGRRAAPIELDLLDPSAFSIEETAASLRPPFRPGAHLCTTLQDLEPRSYPVVWAVHGLYAIPVAELDAALERFVATIEPGGVGFIAQARRDAHYVAFHDLYLEGRPGVEPYAAAEDVEASLARLGASVEVRDIVYEGVVADEAVLEGYLQRCLFDDTRSLVELRADPHLGPYLETHRHGDTHRFPQQVALVFVRR